MKRAVLTAALLLAPLLSAPAASQSPQPLADQVVATVNDQEIRTSDLMRLRQSLPPQLQRLPFEQIANQLVERLIDQSLLAGAARAEGLDKDADVMRQVRILTNSVLQDAYLEKVMAAALTQDKLKKAYAAKLKTTAAPEETKARHILVKTEEEAKKIIAELGSGGDFAKIAKARSLDTVSGAQGGDLGYFDDSVMVPPFAKALSTLKDGETTQSPVQTQFGWHVIQVEGRRKGEPPSYDQMIPELRRDLSRTAYEDAVSELRKNAKITRGSGAAAK